MELLSPTGVIDSFKAALSDSLLYARLYECEVAVKKNAFRTIWLHVERDAFREAVEHVCELQEYPHLPIISCSDLGQAVELTYHFTIYYGRRFAELSLGLRVDLPKTDLKGPTITDLIPGALFAEREIQEMIGVEVTGIPDSRRLFLPDDFPDGVYPWRTDETGPPADMLRVLPGRQQKQC